MIKQIIIYTFLLACAVSGHARKAGKATLTAPLDATAWEAAQWISAADAPVVTAKVTNQTRSADGASWFVSDLTNDDKIVSAKWMTTGLGVYDLYINGKLVGEEFLKPGYTHHAKTRRSFTYDITDMLNSEKGNKNTLSARVTPGWWADRVISTRGKEGMIGKKCAFRGVLEITYANGDKKLYGTNTEAWKAGIAGKIQHAAIYDGEEFDNRRPEGFTSTSLGVPEMNEEFTGEILPTAGGEIYLREDLKLLPLETYVWDNIENQDSTCFGKVIVSRRYKRGEPIKLKKGEKLVVDFGQNCSAIPRFRFHAKEGTKLRCEPGEILNDGNGSKERGMDGPEGSVHRKNLRIPETGVRIDYTFANTADPVEYEPRATFFGYRYLSVSADDDVTIYDIATIPVSSIKEDMEIGNITTGNGLINRLILNTLWGMRSNYLSVPTDCPQRNERAGWTADTQIFAETGTYFADTKDFFHKWLRDLRDTQLKSGSYPSVAPPSLTGKSQMRLGWADAGIIVPYVVWKQFGDTAVINENWDSMVKYINHIAESGYNHEALKKENGNFQFADWLSYEPLESNSGKYKVDGSISPEAIAYWNFLGASYLAMDLTMMRDMALATCRDATEYEKLLENTKKRIRLDFFNENGDFKSEILNTMQTPALFALKDNIPEGEAKKRMISRLRDNFKRNGDCLQTGFLGTSILMGTLTDNGMEDIAYELLFQRKNPSWLYSVDNGATTIWERWNSYTKENGMGPAGMNSFNHYAYGVVCEWIWETVAGIATDPSAPGFKRIIMKPVPDRRLGFVDATYKSPAGDINSAWRYEGDNWIWRFSVPEGSTAIVTLPGETSSKEYKGGDYEIVKKI